RASSHYAGLELAPQLGLIPIGESQASGAWEFAVWGTGAVAASADAPPEPEHAIELVLVPGGSFTMGGQRAVEAWPDNPFPIQDAGEDLPPHAVQLAPFFIGAHEITQAQWERLTRTAPSFYSPTTQPELVTSTHPVESLDWYAARRGLGVFGLDLPTEAQWEFAASAGSRDAFWFGTDPLALETVGNVVDLTLAERDATRFGEYAYWGGREFIDGRTLHAPIGSFRPNPFGLYDVHGNVFEWCLDATATYDTPAREGDGLRSAEGAMRMLRGGGWNRRYQLATLSRRSYDAPTATDPSFGLRAARPLDPRP
ncbi:MAG: formylglycine-generating enzyme family protein, partial [Planctomycetota bacterium]